jgi:hypothetical protein
MRVANHPVVHAIQPGCTQGPVTLHMAACRVLPVHQVGDHVGRTKATKAADQQARLAEYVCATRGHIPLWMPNAHKPDALMQGCLMPTPCINHCPPPRLSFSAGLTQTADTCMQRMVLNKVPWQGLARTPEPGKTRVLMPCAVNPCQAQHALWPCCDTSTMVHCHGCALCHTTC